MRDIAARVGVSQPVVSKALFGGSTSVRISEEVRAAVLRAADELGYRPNAAARTLTRKRFGSVTLVQYAYRNWSYLPQVLLESIVAALEAKGLGLSVQTCDHEQIQRQEAPPRLLRLNDADGLLINVNHGLGAPLRDRFHAQRVPAVWLNHDHGGDSVVLDDRGAAEGLTRLLMEGGHRHLRYLGLGINPEENHASKSTRPDGYANAVRAAGRPPVAVLAADAANAKPHVAALCAGPDGPGTWLVYGPGEAELLIGLAAERGWRIGRDLRFAIFAPPHGALRSLAAAVAEEPLDQFGQAAVDLLLAKIATPEATLPSRHVPWRITAQPETA